MKGGLAYQFFHSHQLVRSLTRIRTGAKSHVLDHYTVYFYLKSSILKKNINKLFYLYAGQTKLVQALVWPGLSQDVISSALGNQKIGEPSEGALTPESEDGIYSCLCLALDFGKMIFPC